MRCCRVLDRDHLAKHLTTRTGRTLPFAHQLKEEFRTPVASPPPNIYELNVTMNRSIASRRLLFPIALIAACALMAWVSFGPQLLRDSRKNVEEPFYCVTQYEALREYHFEPDKPVEGMVRCAFGGISFEIPSTLADQPRILRSSPSSIWLVFEDHGRFMQIPLSDASPASMISTPPPGLVNTTIPGLIATIAAVSSKVTSTELTLSERSIYDWALINRGSIGLDKAMDRFSVRSLDTLHAILISVDPNASFSEKQIRSWLVWHETESDKSGSMMFGDSNNARAKWINAFATSIEFIPNVATNDLAANDYSTMTDDEILASLSTYGPNQPEVQPGRTMP